MPKAARVGDACRESLSGAPLVVLPAAGSKSLMIGNQAAAVTGEQIVSGSPTVFVDNRPLARSGDKTVTQGEVAQGCSNVQIDS